MRAYIDVEIDLSHHVVLAINQKRLFDQIQDFFPHHDSADPHSRVCHLDLRAVLEDDGSFAHTDAINIVHADIDFHLRIYGNKKGLPRPSHVQRNNYQVHKWNTTGLSS